MITQQSVFLFALLAAAAPAQSLPAAVHYFGANSCDLPMLVSGAPRPGNTIQIVSRGTVLVANHFVPTYVMLGLSTNWIGSLPLPLAISSQFPGASSCGQLLQSADWMALMPAATQWLPTVAFDIAIPNDPDLIGLSLACQTLLAANMFYPQYAITSNGAHIRVGM